MYFIMNPQKEAFTYKVCRADVNCGGYAFDFDNGSEDLKFLPYLTPEQLASDISDFEYSITHWETELKKCLEAHESTDEAECGLATCQENLKRLKENEQKILKGLQDYGLLFYGRNFTDDEIEQLEWYDTPLARDFMVKYLLYNFDFIRKVENFSELKPNEYGVVYRTGCEDFHFARYDNGIYSGKRGKDITSSPNEEDCFDENWEEMYYDSESIYFAVKKKEFR